MTRPARPVGSGGRPRIAVVAAGLLGLLALGLLGPTSAQATPSAAQAVHAAQAVPAASGGGPTVTKIVSARGPATGGSSVRITGTNFDGATVVRFGGVASPSFHPAEAGAQVRNLDAIAPPHAVGAVAVTVTTPAGTSAVGAAAMFSYQRVHGHWIALPARQRFSHTATLLADGKVLVAGGCIQVEPNGRCGRATATAELYDPARRSWSDTAPMTVPRIGQLATLLADGRVLVSGGCATLGCSSENNPAADFSTEFSAEIYDPSWRRWTPTRNMLFIHNHPTAALLPAGPPSQCAPNCGKVLVVGTAVTLAGGRAVPASTDAEIYDPRSGTWAATTPTEHSRDRPSALRLGNGRVLVVGIVSDLPPLTAVAAELFDPATAMWTPTGNAEPFPQASSTTTAMADGRVLVVASDPTGVRKGEELYDPSAAPDPANPSVRGGAWSVTGALADLRVGNTATLLHDGTVLVAGGGSVPPFGTAELYNEKTATWTSAGTMAGGRGLDQYNCSCTAFTATALKNGAVLVVGASFRIVGFLDRFVPLIAQRSFGPDAYGPSAELYTPATTSSGASPVVLVLVVAAVVLIAIGAVVIVRRRGRRTTEDGRRAAALN